MIVAASSWSLLGADPALAQHQRALSIHDGTLAQAIDQLSGETGVSIGTDGPLPTVHVRAVHGRMRVEDALQRLLQGTGLIARRVGANAFRIERAPPSVAPPTVKPRPAPQAASRPAPPVIAATPIIVTAGKQAQSLDSLSLDIAIVRVGNRGLTLAPSSSAAIANAVEGVSLTGLGSGRNRMFLRGVADSSFSGSTQSTVAVVLDESRVTFSAPDPDLRLVDAERVEVIKGPQGSLYGSGTLGGIYHIVMRQPELDRFEGSATADVTAVSGGGIGNGTSGVLNLPLAHDRLAVRVVGWREVTPGWIDTGPRQDSNSLTALGGRAAVLWRGDGGWSGGLSGQFQRLASKDSQYVYAPDSLRRPAQLAEPHDNDFNHVAAHLSGPAGAAQLQIISGYTWHEVGDTYDATIGATAFGLPQPSTFTDDRRYRVWESEARISGRSHRWRWLIGLSHLMADERTAKLLASGAPAVAPLALEMGRRTANETALFGEMTLDLTRTLAVSAGGRLFHATAEDVIATPAGSFRREVGDTGLTPVASVAWHPSAGRLLYVRYASAARPGGLAAVGGGAATSFEGDEVVTLEAGYRQDVAGGDLSISGHVTWWDNVQSDMLLANGLVETRNAGRARIVGIEASLTHALGHGFTVEAGASVQHAVLVSNALGVVLDDRRLPVVPDYSLRGGLERTFALGGSSATLGLHLHYLGPARLSFDPALDRQMGKSLDADFDAGLRKGSWELALRVENLLNNRANLFAYGNPFRIRTMPQYTPQRPLTVKASIGRAF